MGLFSKKKKTFAERFPTGAAAYNLLNDAQKKVLDDFSYAEEKHLKADKKLALERIIEHYILPQGVGLSVPRLKIRAKQVYQGCLQTLKTANLTTNVSSKLFALDGFFNGSEVKTVWTFNTNKGTNYGNTRQAVEENVFGYTIDWNVPIAQAAMTRPVYAGMNYSAHPYGAATAYGSVCLVLNSGVNHRSTFINTDTFDASFNFKAATGDQLKNSLKKVCTFAQLDTLIANISNNQLKALCKKSEGQLQHGDHPPNYIEAQVHGGIQWARDLAGIRVATSGSCTLEKEAASAGKSANTLAYLIGEFAQKYNVPAGIYHQGNLIKTLN